MVVLNLKDDIPVIVKQTSTNTTCMTCQFYTRNNRKDQHEHFEQTITPEDTSVRQEAIHPSYDNDHQPSLSCLDILHCDSCKQDIAVLQDDRWLSIDDFLHRPNTQDGVTRIKTELDRKILFVLSEICYNQCDINRERGESPFGKYPSGETGWIVWTGDRAVGFYTLKLAGDPVSASLYESYKLPMLDTVYVRAACRGRGLARTMIQHYISQYQDQDQYQNQDIGFSSPVSTSLLAVLHRLLLHERHLQDYLWEVSYDGSEGHRRNVWFHTKRFFRKRKLAHKSGSVECKRTRDEISDTNSREND